MRPSFVALAGSLLLSACVSGTRVVYVPVPADNTAPAPAVTPTPPPPPVEVAQPPVAVTIVRAEENRLLVSLDRPSYLAVFDIVPGRGVTILYPTSARQRQVTMVGARWLDPRWGTLNRYDAASSGRYARNDRSLTHYVYAVASERPLRLSRSAFDDDLLANMLGVRATWVDDPYDTRDAIVRQFVSATRDEDWGEDMYMMDAMRAVQTVRVARVYCADGSIMYVREELADRAYCPRSVNVRGSGWGVRPDSVVSWNGRRVTHNYDPNARTPVYRIPRTIGGHAVDRTAEARDDGNNGNNGNAGNSGNVGNRGNSGNNGNAANGRDNDDRGNNGNKDNNGNHSGWRNGNNGNNGNANNGNSTGQASGNQSGTNVQQQGQPQGNGNAQNNGNGNAQNNGNGNASNNGNAHGNNEHAHGQPQNAKPETQPAPPAESKPAVTPDSAKTSKPSKPSKPKSLSDILKRASGKDKTTQASDSTSKKPF